MIPILQSFNWIHVPIKAIFLLFGNCKVKGKWTDYKVLNSIYRQPNAWNVSWWRQCTAHSVLLVKSFYFNSNNKLVKWFQWKATDKQHSISSVFWKKNIAATYPAIRWRFICFDIIDSILKSMSDWLLKKIPCQSISQKDNILFW